MSPASRWLPQSLVGRVFALYTVTLVGFVTAGLGLFYGYQFSVELADAQARAETLVEVMLPTVSDSAVIGDYDTIRRTLERAVHHSSFSKASYIDLRGGVVGVPRDDPPAVSPPGWLLDSVASRLYDSNHTITVGGRDYGVLRLSFAPDRIAGDIWAQTRIALALGLVSVLGGLLLIRMPLVRWLGDLNRVQDFERAVQSGEGAPPLPGALDAPLEFRQTFEVLGRVAASLQQQRAQAAVTLVAIADGVFTLDDTGGVVLANPAACAMTGQSPQSLLGRRVTDVLPQLAGELEPLQPWRGRRVTLAGPDGRAVVVDTTLSGIAGPSGEIVGYVLACRDVSEQHQLDLRLRAELQSREAALVSLRKVLEGLTADAVVATDAAGTDDLSAISTMIAELVSRLQVRGEQLDAIFALSPDGFVSFDTDRRANYVSPAFTRLTGLPARSVLGAPEAEIETWLRAHSLQGSDWQGFEGLRRRGAAADSGPQSARELLDLQRPMRRVLEIALRQGTTEVISQVLSLRDVTHETEVDLIKSEFLSTAAHELRTPMASIYGFTELLLHRRMSPERQADVLATIHRQTELMIAIINELLDLARIEARRGKDFELQTLDLHTLVSEVVRDFKPPGQRAGPQVVPAAQPLPVRVDRKKAGQALSNVLSNAFKYSPAGGEVHVRLLAGPDPAVQEAGVEIRDEGIGMTAAQMDRVSERFYRADTSGSIPGTGLGMSIVKEIVDLLGGRLALASTPGVGTAVTIWLPLARETVS